MPTSHPVSVALRAGSASDSVGRVVVARISAADGVQRLSEGFGAVFYIGGPIDAVSSMHSGVCDVFFLTDAGIGSLEVALLERGW
jgi:hypothetical protein